MAEKVLLLGHTGKLGRALHAVLSESCEVIGKNSRDFHAEDESQVRRLVADHPADIVINTVAFMGIDLCERQPDRAWRINALFPRILAELASRQGFILVHFSTDAVFNDEKQDYYLESDPARPVNLYGITKYAGDCAVQAAAEKHYLIRVPVQFGLTRRRDQFVEKMIARVRQGQKQLRIAHDIVSSPTYSHDVAVRVRQILEKRLPFGLYHVANDGKASLYELMQAVVENLSLGVTVQPGSYRDFPHEGRKNLYTPLRSEKIPPLRPWTEAVKEFCQQWERLWERSPVQ